MSTSSWPSPNATSRRRGDRGCGKSPCSNTGCRPTASDRARRASCRAHKASQASLIAKARPRWDCNGGTAAMSATPTLADFRRIVVKVGSSLIVDAQASRVKEDWLPSLADDIAALHKDKRDVLVVSSGAIALGRAVLNLPKGPLKLEDSQAAAAVGQIALARTWTQALSRHGITAGQVLVTLQDTEERRRYLNARSTVERLLEWRAVPVINENDTVATNEIRYGDNDRLAARVATMASADLLVLLSDVDGLYDAPPERNADAKLIPLVERITPQIEAMAGSAASELSRGGMVTKIEAAWIATTGGTPLVIASGRIANPLNVIMQGARCTWFLAPANPVTSRKKWIAGSLEPKGVLTIDAGAVAALRRGRSLLPVGVIKVEGEFARGDAVIVRELTLDLDDTDREQTVT